VVVNLAGTALVPAFRRSQQACRDEPPPPVTLGFLKPHCPLCHSAHSARRKRKSFTSG